MNEQPNWTPLEQLADQDLSISPDEYMWMGRKGAIELYKHIETRRYLNIDSQGQTYSYQMGNTYAPIAPSLAIEWVLS